MNKKIMDFLDSVCKFVNCKEAHPEIRDELSMHIEDLQAELIGKGYSEISALDTAITAMGESSVIGSQLNKQHKPRFDWLLIGLITIIAFIGAALMTVCRQYETVMRINYSKYVFYAIIGIGIMALLCFFDYRKLVKKALPLFVISFIFFLFCTFGAYILANYCMNFEQWYVPYYYIYIMLRFVKQAPILLFTVSYAGIIYRYKGKGAIAVMKLITLALLSLFAVPFAAPIALLSCCYGVLLFNGVIKKHFGGSRNNQLFILFGGIILAAGIIILFNWLHLHFRNNIISSLWYWDFVNQADSQQPYYWLSTSKWFGQTDVVLNGKNFFMSMPFPLTDYALINVAATLGRAVALALIIVITLLAIRMLRITYKIRNTYGFFLSLTACTVLSAQFILTILMCLGLFPRIRMGLPFISYGITNYVVCAVLAGLILSTWYRNHLVSENIPVK